MRIDEQQSRDNANNARNRRRQYIVNPAFQWKYVLTSAATVFVVSGAISLILYTLLHQQARMRAMSPTTGASDVASVVLTFAGAFAVLTAAAVGIWGVVLTHRVCGPIYIMHRYLVEFTKGKIPNMRPLRQKDEFKDFHATLARAFDTVRTNKERERESLRRVLQAATAAIDADDDARKDAILTVKRSLESLCHEADDALGIPHVTPTPNTPHAVAASIQD